MIDFPPSPTEGQIHPPGGGDKTWIWNGYAWDLQAISDALVQTAENASAAALASEAAAAASAAAAAGAVLGTPLTGLSTSSNTAITAADAVLSAFGKLQAQITGVLDRALTGLSVATSTAVTATDSVLVAIGKLQSQVTLRAPLASPTFTGVPAVPTAAAGTNTTQAASTAYVRTEVASLVASAPGVLDTLDELAAALGDDPNFATTVMNALAAKAPLDSPAFTGAPTAPTAAAGTSTTQLASTAFAMNAVNTAKTTLEPNAQTGTSYTLALSDAGKRVALSNAAANVVTVPPNSTAAFPVNTTIFVSQDGAGATSVAAGAGVTINTAEGLKVGAQYKMISLIKTATDTWMAIGSTA